MIRTLQPCGTWAGYLRHWKAGEKACEPCRQAGREHSKAYYERRGREQKRQRRRALNHERAQGVA